MVTVEVGLNERSYPIYIGANVLADKLSLNSLVKGHQALVVTNQSIADLYLPQVMQTLQHSTLQQIDTLILPEGEAYKTLDTIGLIYDHLLHHNHQRTTQIVALGGGVIGDMAGFAAATYQRGVAFIQVPTTLLAQVDSSVGGKTGVNHPMGKNMIGAFHQPRGVVIDTTTLTTLPKREISAGLAEIIKYGLLGDKTFLRWLHASAPQLLALEPDFIAQAVAHSCQMKANIVEADERETGQRALLNLGHTFGHAIESQMGYGQWLHGEAVGLGLLLATDLSARLGFITQLQVKWVEEILNAFHLPTRIPQAMTHQLFWQAMRRDKKVENKKIRFILLESIGKACIKDSIETSLVDETLSAYSE